MYLNSPAVSFPLLTFYLESLRTTGEIILDHEECFLLEIIQIMIIMWKTMPGRVKQVPRDSTECDRTDTGHCAENHLHV